MSGKRTYRDSCGIARALDRVGERWALLIARELVLGPKRFTDLRAGLPGIGPDVLAQRLRDLEAAGVVRRRELPAPAASRVYELTEWGAKLEPVLVALGRWGSRAALPAGAAPLGVDAALVALQTTFDPAAAIALDETYGLVLDDQGFVISVSDGALKIRRRTDPGPDPVAAVTVATDTGTLAAIAWHGRGLADALADGAVTLVGDPGAAERLLSLFRAPVPAG
ncbi:MAG: winged helix-turn-helix transcriptional regulator [Solirubrobacteraceae bacterium]